MYISSENPTALIAVMDIPKATKEMSALMTKAKFGIGGMMIECDQANVMDVERLVAAPYQDG